VDELAETFQVSIGVVREAVRVLVEKGLVESRQRSGTRVRARDHWRLVDPEVMAWYRAAGPSLALLRDLTEVRAAIEPYAAGLAAERALPEDIAILWELCASMTASLDDVDAHTRADLAFHSAVLRATHNELLIQLTATIAVALEASRDVTVRSPGASLAAMPLHADVAAAIEARDPDRARAAMAELVDRASVDIERTLGRRTSDEVPTR
jgi:DNA-binding FadR family transcriptional regulator